MTQKRNIVVNASATIAAVIAGLQEAASSPETAQLLQQMVQVAREAANSVTELVSQFKEYAGDV